MMRRNFALTLVFILLTVAYGVAQTRGVGVKLVGNQPSEKRIALVIGNAAYTHSTPLVNPVNDATDMAATLKALGFEVISGTNQNKRQIETMIRQFGTRLAETKGVGLFFYAGHGLQVSGENYIVPVDAEIPEADEVQYQAVPMNMVLSKMNSAGNDLNIVILDACRNNPFARSWRGFRDVGDSGGLARITPPQGTIVLYATQPGNVASDGSGRNGLFTESLLTQIKRPNVELDAMVKALTRDVSEKSGKKQFPWREGTSTGDFYFAGGQTVPVIPTSSTAAAGTAATGPVSIASGKVRKNSIGIELVYIAPGEFMMGSSEADIDEAVSACQKASPDCVRSSFADETPRRRVVIKEGFWMGKYEVTNEQYESIMGKDSDGNHSNYPMATNWEGAKEFVTKLNAKKDGFVYSLPSEAEWEYAARAGTTTPFAFGNTLTSDQANINGTIQYGDAPKGRSLEEATPVGSYEPNAWGLYDMHGNLFEWVEDIYSSSYAGLRADGAPNTKDGDASLRVARGGAFYGGAILARSASRVGLTPVIYITGGFTGFRIVARPTRPK